MGNGVYAFDMSAIWDRLQGLDRNDIVASCLAKLCNRIGKDRDSSDMISRLHDLSHPRAQNGISDSLVRTVKSLHREISLQEERIYGSQTDLLTQRNRGEDFNLRRCPPRESVSPFSELNEVTSAQEKATGEVLNLRLWIRRSHGYYGLARKKARGNETSRTAPVSGEPS
ncbi:hypothetical protein F2Q68_00002192 [Brassica cretica]|uniref:Uncharacterized protein n=1 Tax=Brassica cretica TaxID=69181 RepID=A0A8S9JAU5_BRACR|nr:hypothetical protein F2Q68_00002192 [Brassica cretica]